MAGILGQLADQYGFSPETLDRYVQIESGGNPNARTGSYKGLFQLSDSEFNKYGGGNIYDTADNAKAGVAKLAAERDTFINQYGRDPSPTELYLIHQQGPAGFAAHYGNPDQPAWQSMASTGEGRQKGEAWAKAAIWGNIPDSQKAQFGNVNNVTSQQFMDLWRNKVEGGQPTQTASGSPAGMPMQAGGLPIPQQQAPGIPMQQGSQNPLMALLSRTGGQPMNFPQSPEVAGDVVPFPGPAPVIPNQNFLNVLPAMKLSPPGRISLFPNQPAQGLYPRR